jgi:hypothetical protein
MEISAGRDTSLCHAANQTVCVLLFSDGANVAPRYPRFTADTA